MSNKQNLFRIPPIYIDTINNQKKNNLLSQKVADNGLSINTLNNNKINKPNKIIPINFSREVSQKKVKEDLLQKNKQILKESNNDNSDKSEYIIEEQINKELNNINNKIKNFTSDTSEESENSKFKITSNKKEIIEQSISLY